MGGVRVGRTVQPWLATTELMKSLLVRFLDRSGDLAPYVSRRLDCIALVYQYTHTRALKTRR